MLCTAFHCEHWNYTKHYLFRYPTAAIQSFFGTESNHCNGVSAFAYTSSNLDLAVQSYQEMSPSASQTLYERSFHGIGAACHNSSSSKKCGRRSHSQSMSSFHSTRGIFHILQTMSQCNCKVLPKICRFQPSLVHRTLYITENIEEST